jgi:glucose-6-phosphate 1-dehydrogenase
MLLFGGTGNLVTRKLLPALYRRYAAGQVEQYDERPKIYVAGSWGPAASSAMIGRDGFAWHDEL